MQSKPEQKFTLMEYSCKGCAHLPVCIIFRQVSKFLSSEFQGNAPILDVNLAGICTQYLNISVTKVLKDVR